MTVQRLSVENVTLRGYHDDIHVVVQFGVLYSSDLGDEEHEYSFIIHENRWLTFWTSLGTLQG